MSLAAQRDGAGGTDIQPRIVREGDVRGEHTGDVRVRAPRGEPCEMGARGDLVNAVDERRLGLRLAVPRAGVDGGEGDIKAVFAGLRQRDAAGGVGEARAADGVEIFLRKRGEAAVVGDGDVVAVRVREGDGQPAARDRAAVEGQRSGQELRRRKREGHVGQP